MSQRVSVEKCKNGEPQGLWERFTAMADEVRRRAFSRFERRGQTDGLDLEDWLEAERDVVWSPASELVEGAGISRLAWRWRASMPRTSRSQRLPRR